MRHFSPLKAFLNAEIPDNQLSKIRRFSESREALADFTRFWSKNNGLYRSELSVASARTARCSPSNDASQKSLSPFASICVRLSVNKYCAFRSTRIHFAFCILHLNFCLMVPSLTSFSSVPTRPTSGKIGWLLPLHWIGIALKQVSGSCSLILYLRRDDGTSLCVFRLSTEPTSRHSTEPTSRHSAELTSGRSKRCFLVREPSLSPAKTG